MYLLSGMPATNSVHLLGNPRDCNHSAACTGFPCGPVVNSPANAGGTGSILGSGRSPGGGNGYSLQYSYLENSMDRGAMGSQSRTLLKRLSTQHIPGPRGRDLSRLGVPRNPNSSRLSGWSTRAERPASSSVTAPTNDVTGKRRSGAQPLRVT